MTCASAWMEAALADPDGGQRWVIYDEAWRLLRQPSLLARMQAQWKLSRALGIANLMVIHRISDLDAVGDANSQNPKPRPRTPRRLLHQDHLRPRTRRSRQDRRPPSDCQPPKPTNSPTSNEAKGYGESASAPSWFATPAPPASWTCTTPTAA